ncbi:hypothetical protein JRQ81_015050 [Phrynocephalus forsythii]|uniref:Uncharacterized protein n=1 Tax=Phrynocephalus forsythii TaxID=171643 RepID=A0A9Q0XYV6_9SAUR|nr:hypothetical protein JRQ81_015050 [Phrynocephalus forsythii]
MQGAHVNKHLQHNLHWLRPVKGISSAEVEHVAPSACGYADSECALPWGKRGMNATRLAIRFLSLENGNITPVHVCQIMYVPDSSMADIDAH